MMVNALVVFLVVVLVIGFILYIFNRDDSPAELPGNDPSVPPSSGGRTVGQPAVTEAEDAVSPDTLIDELRLVQWDVWLVDERSGYCLRVLSAGGEVHIERLPAMVFNARQPGDVLRVRVISTETTEFRTRVMSREVDVMVAADRSMPHAHRQSPVSRPAPLEPTSVGRVYAEVKRATETSA
jgi:hypothetical protein